MNRIIYEFSLEVKRRMVQEKVIAVIAKQLEISESEVKMDSLFIDDLGADSLDIVDLIMALEDEFDIEISDEDAEDIKTVKDIVDYINSVQ